MSKLDTFFPKEKREAARDLKDFIGECHHQLTLFDDIDGFDWNSYEWPGFRLTKLGHRGREITKDVRLGSAFVDFAGAYYRHKHSHNPLRQKSERYALKAIEAALTEKNGSGNLTNITKHTLDRAASLATDYYSHGTAYRVNREIRKIAAFLNENHLVTSHLADWKSPIRWPDSR